MASPARAAAALRAALDHKDAAAVAAMAGRGGRSSCRVWSPPPAPAAPARAALDRLDLPAQARDERDRLGAVLDGLAAAMPALKVTVDPVENRGFEYHTGISFTFFARVDPERGPLGELGRGGRYQAGDPAAPEPATGFTLYTDTILRTLPEATPRRRVLVPFGAERGARPRRCATRAGSPSRHWRPPRIGMAEARRLGCGHVLGSAASRVAAAEA